MDMTTPSGGVITKADFDEFCKQHIKILNDIYKELESQRNQINVIPYQHANQKYQFITVLCDKRDLKAQLDTLGDKGFQVQALSKTDVIGEVLVIMCRPLNTLYPDMPPARSKN